MNKYNIFWYNYQAQQTQSIDVLALSQEDAEKLALRYMDALFPFHAPHSKNDIEDIKWVEDIKYMDEKEIHEFEIKQKEAHFKWFVNQITDPKTTETYHYNVMVKSDFGKDFMKKYEQYFIREAVYTNTYFSEIFKKYVSEIKQKNEYDMTNASFDELIDVWVNINPNKIDKFDISSQKL